MKLLLAGALALALTPSVFAQKNLSGTPEIKLALDRLTVLGSVLMIAAHPDDENTAALAYWARGRHLRTAYLSATRGEGGQNLIGSEQGDLLGAIRTQELLAARRIDGAQQFFTRAVDFGFTKTPQETMEKWGHDEILADMVWVIRQFQPDVVVLRFSGTPRDGHGQHQASAILGKEAYFAAADAKRFPEQLKFVKPWQAKRLMWNAFAFSPAEEKDVEKMAGRLEFDTGVYNPLLGKSYAEIAGISRSEHRSQAMGSPERKGPSRNFLTPVAGAVAAKDLFDGVDTSWSRVAGAEQVKSLLAMAAAQFSPEAPERSVKPLMDARALVLRLAAGGDAWARVKLTELDEALALCAGIWVDAEADKFGATPSGPLKVTLNAIGRSAQVPVRGVSASIEGAGVKAAGDLGAAFPVNAVVTKAFELKLPAEAPLSQPFWLAKPAVHNRYDIANQLLIGRPDPVPAMMATFTVKLDEAELTLVRPVEYHYVDRVRGELTRPLTVVPAVALDLPETVLVFPTGESRSLQVRVVANVGSATGEVRVETDAGWRLEPASRPFSMKMQGEMQELTFTVTPGAGAGAAGHFRASATVNGAQVASGITTIAYEHIPPQTLFYPSAGMLREVPLQVLAKRVGYVMGAGDEVPDALRQMGCDVTLLTAQDLAAGDLARFDAIVTGVRAYNVRSDLRANQLRLLEYVKNGGTMVVQYNVVEDRRFGRGPDVGLDRMGPYPFTVGRDRVTVEEAPVEFMSMKNPLLRAPNAITAKDFEGWVQERGLYFASEWDPKYEAVLSTHDPGEKGLAGGMLFTRYGKGAYVFSSYSWFRQLPAGVPGAYRLFANMLSAGKAQ